MWRFEDFVEASARVQDDIALQGLLTDVLAQEGYDNHLLASIDEHRVRSVRWSRYPNDYFHTYQTEDWHLVDPLLPHAARAAHPFLWKDLLAGLRLTRKQAQFMEDAGNAGVNSGILIPVPGPAGRSDILSFSKIRKDDVQDLGRIPVLQAFATQAWACHVNLRQEPLLAPKKRLSPREKEILSWVKDGKSNAEISEILTIAVGTVEYHLRRVFVRLEAGNRISAVVIALREGLLEL